jgi:threonine dehydrogenase-like Zn-dependent dehydrogenase
VRQVTFVEPGRLEWWDVDAPTRASVDDALVRPVAVATCDLDVAIVRGTVPFQGPFPFGHECVAEVVEGPDGAGGDLAPGALVSVPFQISCGTCERCRRGQTANCESVPRMSSYGLGQVGGEWGGFLSDVVRVPFARHMLVALPPGVDPAAAASVSDNVPDAWRTVADPLERRPGATVLICAGGSIGLYAAAIALALGSERVDYADEDPRRLELAEQLGANPLPGPFPRRLGKYPVTVDASASHAGLACAIRSTEPDGICTSVGIYFEPETPVPLLEMHAKGIEFRTGRPHARTIIPDILALIASGRLRPEAVTARVVGWDDAADALADHGEKLVVTRS